LLNPTLLNLTLLNLTQMNPIEVHLISKRINPLPPSDAVRKQKKIF